MKNIILIGGGEIGKGETKEIDLEIKKLAPRGSSFVFFGTAANDAEGYIKTIESVYGDYFDVVAATTEKGRHFSENAINNASIIYLGGGLTELLMKHFEEWNLVPILADAIDKGAVAVGMSAGAQALSQNYIHEEQNLMEVRKGWGLSDSHLCILVHSTKENFNDAKKVYNYAGLSGGLYGIAETAALLVQSGDGTAQKLGTGDIFKYA